MRKTFLYVCVIAVLAMILPSCLGDPESESSGSRQYGVIAVEDNIVYARVLNGNSPFLITWDGIKSSYSEGDAVLLSYKVSTKNMISGTYVFNAEYANVEPADYYPNSVQLAVTPQTVDTTRQTNSAFFATLNMKQYNPSDYYLDRWMFNYTANPKDGEVYTPSFYYDASKQVQKNGTALPTNAAIVDVVLRKTGTPVTGAVVKPVDQTIVVNMQGLRAMLLPPTSTEDVTRNIWFRIMKEDSKATNGYTLTYMQNVGSLGYPKGQ